MPHSTSHTDATTIPEEGAELSTVNRVRTLLAEDATQGEVQLRSSMKPLFCQMDVLCHFDDNEVGWKEMARWLKYEEKVEAGDRWSKPHVATTSLHALTELRQCLEQHTIILDMVPEHDCVHQVMETIVTSLQQDAGFDGETRNKILDVLLKPHKHKHRKGKRERNENQEQQIPNHVNHVNSENSKESVFTKLKQRFKVVDESRGVKEVSALYHTYPSGLTPADLKPHKSNKKFMKKIPGGSEAANILIGQVDFLQEPVMALVRMGNSSVLGDLTEISLPTRFIFLALGPPETTTVWECTEVGRAMACLLTDMIFCEVAYKSTERKDILDGIDEFIDDLTVLPPSIWDPATRLDPPETTRSEDKIKRRLMESSRHAAGPEAFHFSENAGEDTTLMRTGRFFGGFIKDIRRRYPWYWSDIRDGFNPQCLGSIVFLYFACISPTVTFGGLLGQATDGWIGTMETLLAGVMCGLIYHVFAGQPLSIIGVIGPSLVFEGILYQFCKGNNIDFMGFRFWIGMWIALILIIIVAFDLSALVRYITRFTEESFAVLISLIFIWDAFNKQFQIYDSHPIYTQKATDLASFTCHCEPPAVWTSVNSTATTLLMMATTVASVQVTGYNITPDDTYELHNWTSVVPENCITYKNRVEIRSDCISEVDCLLHRGTLVGPACYVRRVTHSVPDVFFFSCFLFIGTFVIAIFFRHFRNSTFFPSVVRSTFADFSVLIAIIVCTTVDKLTALDTPKLEVPSEFKCTRDDRTWIINPMTVEWYLIIVAVVPALLATILIFLAQQITAVIVNRKEHKLKKGHGYHLDLFILSFTIVICSIMGLPWFVAATVRTVTHVRSLIMTSDLRAPGERPQFLGVREQRVTGIVVHILIGCSVFLTTLLTMIPMPVLYGVFLYMGVASLDGVQFVQRILILFMPRKGQADAIYLRHVKTKRVHMFTLIQIFCMIVMWVLKSLKETSLVFPLLILALCFVRRGLDCIFTQSELYWLDHILPDDSRRQKEDKERAASHPHVQVTTPEGQIHPSGESDEDEAVELPIEDEWDEMVARRDYNVGKKPRLRKLSCNIIERYERHKNMHRLAAKLSIGSAISEGEEGEEEDTLSTDVSRQIEMRQRRGSTMAFHNREFDV